MTNPPSIQQNPIIQPTVVAASFSRAASGYDGEPLRFLRESAKFLVASLPLHISKQVLDIATGTGKAAILAAQAMQTNGAVLAVDIAEGMLQQAKANAAQAGMKNIQFIHASADDLMFDDNQFDCVFCSSGIYILRDIPKSVNEWVRVVKPQGTVAFSAFGEGILEPMMAMYESLLRDYGVEIISPTPLYRLNTQELCESVLNDAGLVNVNIQIAYRNYHISSAEEWIALVKNSGFRFPLERLDKKYMDQFIAAHKAQISQLATEKGIHLQVPIIVASGQKPI
jgi:ubiquinone/menaquinone biosynthesis C-methylase UbiE